MIGLDARNMAHNAAMLLLKPELTDDDKSRIRDVLYRLSRAVPGGNTHCVMCSGTGLCYRCMTQEEQVENDPSE